MPILSPFELPIELYHQSAPQWLSKTSIMDFRDHGPAWWKLVYLDGAFTKEAPGGAAQGSMLDCWLTEGEDAFNARYVYVPADAPKRPTSAQLKAKKPSPETLDAIAYWAQFGDRIPVMGEDAAILPEAVRAVKSLPDWKRLEMTRAQHTIRRVDTSMGIGLQSRPDWLELNANAITFDLKKTRSLASFGKQAIDLGYHVQASIAGWCLSGDDYQQEQAFLVAVEWERGARARMYEIPSEALADGFRMVTETFLEIAGRLKSDDWTDRQQSPERLPIPEWMHRRMGAA